MENNNKILTADEKLWIINEVSNSESVSDVLEAINNHFEINQIVEDSNEKKSEIHTVEQPIAVLNDNIEESDIPSNYRNITESGMYRKEALPAVLEDLSSAVEERITSEESQEHHKTRVLKNNNIPVDAPEATSKPVPSIWADDIKLVSPGDIKL